MGKRKAYTPFSLSAEAGVSAAPVEGFIQVDQEVRPTIDTGFVDKKGIWQGHTTSDTAFISYQKDEEVANGAAIITPSVNPDGTWPLDMTGYASIFVAIKPTNAGNYRIQAVMGPSTNSFANLSPVNAAADLRGTTVTNPSTLKDQFLVAAEALIADVWNIYNIQKVLQDQKLLQFKITNNSGDISTIEASFMRLV